MFFFYLFCELTSYLLFCFFIPHTHTHTHRDKPCNVRYFINAFVLQTCHFFPVPFLFHMSLKYIQIENQTIVLRIGRNPFLYRFWTPLLWNAINNEEKSIFMHYFYCLLIIRWQSRNKNNSFGGMHEYFFVLENLLAQLYLCLNS